MSTTVSDEMEKDATSPTDALARLRTMVRRYRDVTASLSDLDERRRQLSDEKCDLEHRGLVDLMMEAGVNSLSIPAEGNLPAFTARLSPFYKAGISSEWSPQRQEEGFAALSRLGWDHLVKSRVEVLFDRGREEEARHLMHLLSLKRYAATLSQSVHHASLTAAVRARYEDGGRIADSDLSAIGGIVGRVVKVREE